MALIHCCTCHWQGQARPVGGGYVCGGCGRYGTPCASCREKVRNEAMARRAAPAEAPPGPTMGQVLADVVRAVLGRREPEEALLIQEPLEVERSAEPEPHDGPTAAEIAQDIQTAHLRAALAKTKEPVPR